jgi:hypothetical protein
MRKVTCVCETVFDADLGEEFDLDATPSVLDEILGGEFLAVSCPSCGARLKPELRVRLVSKKAGIDLVALPELDRIGLYRGAVELPKGSEAVVGYPELFERARIIADALDPEAVEIIKFYLAQKAVEQAPDADISVAYAGKQGGRLTFHVSGLKEGQVAVLPVEQGTYDKTLADKPRTLREAPFDRVFKGQYRSVRAIEAEAED